MRTPFSRVIPALLVLLLAMAPRTAPALEITVPTPLDPDLQTAVGHMMVSGDVDNTIYIASPSITTGSRILLDPSFTSTRRLLIRPATTIARAQIRSTDLSGEPIFKLDGCGYVRFQDLDILRVVTNNGTLIFTDRTALIVFERCRIGSNGAPNTPGLSYMNINYPADGGLTIRNCILFSTFKTAFDYGITVSMGDQSNELYLYNDCVADYNLEGVLVNDFVPLSLVLARNNILVNNTVSNPEPVAFDSQIGDQVIVVTSHNLAFASPAKVQTGFPPNQDLYGTAASQAGVFLPATVFEETSAFSTMSWDPTPGAANPDFYRPLSGGPLHVATAYGVIVGLMSPDIHDKAVIDDINWSIRPGGTPLHVDRGPYQLDASANGVFARGPGAAVLRMAPETNPSRSVRLAYSTGAPGELSVELFDIAGRRVGATRREVAAGETGVLEVSGVRRAGVYGYRATFRAADREAYESSGRICVVR